MLANPSNSSIEMQARDTEATAKQLGLGMRLITASTAGEIDRAFAAMISQEGQALLVASDPFLTARHQQIVDLAAKYSIPAIYPWREYAVAGGLISYGSSNTDAYHRAAQYVARILSGSKPTELPIWQPTKFELVINLNTAKALGLTIPPTLLALADEVIE
jgi:putative ABC transport system substrate-binding protein